MSAREQLDAIDRYLSKNWLDDDFPTDLIYEAVNYHKKLTSIIKWLEQNKPEVFKEGIWEAING